MPDQANVRHRAPCLSRSPTGHRRPAGLAAGGLLAVALSACGASSQPQRTAPAPAASTSSARTPPAQPPGRFRIDPNFFLGARNGEPYVLAVEEGQFGLDNTASPEYVKSNPSLVKLKVNGPATHTGTSSGTITFTSSAGARDPAVPAGARGDFYVDRLWRCPPHVPGTYQFAISDRGQLTLAAINDPCSARKRFLTGVRWTVGKRPPGINP